MKNKTLIITIMCTIVILMSVGYAAFSANLKINGTANIASTWKVVFTKIEKTTQNGTASEISMPTASGTNATFNVDLISPGDYIIYTITVANQGTLDAQVDSINLSDTGSNAVIFTVDGIEEGEYLAKNTTKTFTVKVEYKSSVTSQPSTANLTNKLTLNMNFAQAVGGELPDINLLPTTYQQVEYIESSGNQYINLNIEPNNATKAEAKFFNNSTGSWYIFGSRVGSSGTIEFGQSGSTSGSTIFPRVNGSGAAVGWVRTTTGALYEMSLETKNGVYDYYIKDITNNKTYTKNNVTYTSLSNTQDLYIFALNPSNIQNGTTRFYYFKLYQGGNLIRNLVPCYRKSDNVIGMYDIENDDFYTNQGSGTFSKGSNVN